MVIKDTLSLSVSLCLSVAPSVFFIILSNCFPSLFLIISLNLFAPPYMFLPTHFGLIMPAPTFSFFPFPPFFLSALHPCLFLFLKKISSISVSLSVFAGKSFMIVAHLYYCSDCQLYIITQTHTEHYQPSLHRQYEVMHTFTQAV